jgi:RNA recognition motif-containing protein
MPIFIFRTICKRSDAAFLTHPRQNPQDRLDRSCPANAQGALLFMPTKLYVGNLAYAVTQEDLAELFGQAGKVESAVVVTDKFSGQSRGFGFVEMVEAADAATAIQSLNDTDLKGRRIKIDEARASSGPRGGGGGGGGDRRRGAGGGGGGGGRNRW